MARNARKERPRADRSAKRAARDNPTLLDAIRAGADIPTPERASKTPFKIEAEQTEDGRDTGVRRVRFTVTCPLDAYLHRDQINWRQHDAGAWLSRLYRRAVSSPIVAPRYAERVQTAFFARDVVRDGMTDLRLALVRSGLASTSLPDDALSAGPDATEDMRTHLTAQGRSVIRVCCYEDWAGGTRNLDKLRSGLDLLADYLRIGTRSR